MRLTCSRCGAEYEIDDALIPEGGREVECSSCDHVWFQPGRDGESGTAGTGLPPPPSHQLSENLMGVLRDEVAHFRTHHPNIKGESAPQPAWPTEASQHTDTIAPTHLTEGGNVTDQMSHPGPATASAASVEAPILPAAGHDAQSAPSTADQAQTASRNASAIVAAAAAANIASESPADEAPAPAPVRPKRRGGFRQGFLIGLLIAVAFFAAYKTAPHMGEGMAGDILRQIHDWGDTAHHWLHDKTDPLRQIILQKLAELR